MQPLGDFNKFPKKGFKMRYLNNVLVPKNVQGILDFRTSIVLQNIETNERETLWCNSKNFKKSRIVPEKSE